jgi:hypothetical protein
VRQTLLVERLYVVLEVLGWFCKLLVVLGTCFDECVIIVEHLYLISGILKHEVKLYPIELVNVSVDFAFSWLIDLW